ncbi:MAG: alpha-L-fucosidase, partial [Melioribacteraceae bacterium]|nr:alpha-L-fucosidase [Melioribacteraceae bacterium]
CMFDSKYTDYKVTDPSCAFSSNPRANITKEVFNAFRKDGFWIGAYFSKPDWHHENYWDPSFPPANFKVNYDPLEYPENWQKFVDFTHNQIVELLSDYGKIDILWLDGGWVRKIKKEEIEEFYTKELNKHPGGFITFPIVSQDIKMDELVVKARQKQPGIIVVDREVHGKNQNYLTPEQRVPKQTLPYPWESCMKTSEMWSYTFDAEFIAAREGIHMLIDIVSKGGNLLLNFAPGPDGELQQGAYDLLKEFGDWMDVNSGAIYATKPIAPYKENNICMTQNKNGNVFLFYLAEEGEDKIPSEIRVEYINPTKGAKIKLLGSKTNLKWERLNSGFKIIIPEKLRNDPLSKYAWTFKVSSVEQ